jgi:hypothetical protein
LRRSLDPDLASQHMCNVTELTFKGASSRELDAHGQVLAHV